MSPELTQHEMREAASTVVDLVPRPDALQRPPIQACFAQHRGAAQARDPRWLHAIADGLQVEPYIVRLQRQDRVVGVLPLAFVQSVLFGRFLVSLPYVNSAGVIAENDSDARLLIDRAVELADQLDVRYLELRHERRIVHPALTKTLESKVHMRLGLPSANEQLWQALKPKVRNQIRKGEKQDFEIRWGRDALLGDFYAVFSRNMRDLGTPVFGRRLFASILETFPDEAEFCVVRAADRAVAAALLIHGPRATEVPSASSLREFNAANANMLMYWHLLCRSIERKQPVFDFGRSSAESSTYRFKKQWGAAPHPAVWQYYVRRGTVGDMRPENKKYQRFIRVWQRLPVPLTRWIGPSIVRGIP